MTDAKNPSKFFNALRVVVLALPVLVLFLCMQVGIEPGPLVIAISVVPMALVYFVYPLVLERIAERTTRERKRRAQELAQSMGLIRDDEGRTRPRDEQRSAPENSAGSSKDDIASDNR